MDEKGTDRLEKKKNREKRRRNEVTDRISELMVAVGMAESTMMNPPTSTSCSKLSQTRTDVLARAVNILYALIQENLYLQNVVKTTISPDKISPMAFGSSPDNGKMIIPCFPKDNGNFPGSDAVFIPKYSMDNDSSDDIQPGLNSSRCMDLLKNIQNHNTNTTISRDGQKEYEETHAECA